METFSENHIGELDTSCRKYLVDEEFDKYKKDSQGSYEYDFLVNLFIKFPFLSFEKYQMRNDKEYRTVESFVRKKIEERMILFHLVINGGRQIIRQLYLLIIGKVC